MRISDWSSDVCSSDLLERLVRRPPQRSNEMKHSIRGTVGSDGAANAFLVTNMDEGTSSIQVKVAVDAIVPTSHAQAVNERWEHIRSEERRVGKEWVVRVELGGRRRFKKKKKKE